MDDVVAPEASIGRGLLLLAGFRAVDDAAVIDWMADKCLGLRIFSDAAGAMNLGVADIGGSLLVVPNFTLYGDARKGRRPSFTDAAPPDVATRLFDAFVASLRRGPVPVATGFFQAAMHVELVNDGPVTILLEREPAAPSTAPPGPTR
jgi:D-tyrosyl-tRNA(Tyr) deacylase